MEYQGTSAHAALKPEAGRSALDAMILAFQGIEFLREHVDSDVKIHYTILNCGGTPANIVPASTTASLYVRSYSRTYLDTVIERLSKVLRGAAMMTETEVRIMPEKEVDNKIPAIRLNRLIMDEAEQVRAPRLAPPRENTGSTDFGNILHRIPEFLLSEWLLFQMEFHPIHGSFVDAGKTPEAHSAIIYGAKILSGQRQSL
ncbi:MAG: peptidase dimerization domain-containing protein [Enterocloster bolteae]